MRIRKLLAVLMVASMALGLLGGSAAAQESAEAMAAEATQVLTGFGIVQGDLRLTDKITRAELMELLSVAAGYGEQAELLQPYANPFADVQAGEPYTGHVAVAKAKGWTTGYADGTFRPQNPVTYAEALAFLSRVVGLPPAAGAWPANYITAATEAGIIPAGFAAAANPGDEAVRGAVFVLAHNAFLKVRDESGKSLYQRVWDGTPPTISLNQLDADTTAVEATAGGSVTDASTAIAGPGSLSAHLSGQPLTLAADGSFSASVELAVGPNKIMITAVDYFGNEATESVTVTRSNTDAARIAAPGSLEAEAGGSVVADVAVHDTNGAAIPDAALTVAVEPAELGTFDPATGTFTAGTRAGSGTVTLAAGAATATVAVTVKPAALARIAVSPRSTSIAKGEIATLSVTGYDRYENEISGLTPAFTVDKPNVFVNSAGQFIGSEPGVYTVTATAGGLTDTATVGIYGAVAAVELKGPATVVGNGTSRARFTATVLDEFGNVVAGLSREGGLSVAVDTGLGILLGNGTTATSASLDIAGGVATFDVLGDVAAAGLVGEIEVAYTDAGGNSFPDTATLEVIEQVATGIMVVSQDKYLAANNNSGTAQVLFAVVDQDGVGMQDGIFYDLDLALSDGAPATLAAKTGTYTDTPETGAEYAMAALQSVTEQTGTITVTASAEGLASASATVMADIAGNPAQVIISANQTSLSVTAADEDDERITIKLTIADSKGIPVVARLSGTLTFSDYVIIDAGTYNWGAYWNQIPFDTGSPITPEAPEFVSSVSFDVWSVAAGTVTVGLKDFAWVSPDGKRDDTLKANTLDITFAPGPAEFVGFTRPAHKDLWLPLTNPAATVTVQAYDRFGNPTPQSGVKATVTANTDQVTINGKTADGAVAIRTGSDGAAKLDVTTRPYDTTYTLTLTPGSGVELLPGPEWTEGHTGYYSSLTLRVAAQAPTSLRTALHYVYRDDIWAWYDWEVDYSAADESVKASVLAGDIIRLRVEVLDQYGGTLKGEDYDLRDYLDIEFDDYTIDLNRNGAAENMTCELMESFFLGPEAVVDEDDLDECWMSEGPIALSGEVGAAGIEMPDWLLDEGWSYEELEDAEGNPVPGVYVLEFRAHKAGQLRIKVSLDATVNPITSQSSVAVRPGLPYGIKAVGGDFSPNIMDFPVSRVTIPDGKLTEVNLQVVDFFGNPVNSTATLWNMWLLSTFAIEGSHVELRATSDGMALQPMCSGEFEECIDFDDLDDQLALRGVRKLYAIGKGATPDEPDFEWFAEGFAVLLAYHDTNRNGVFDPENGDHPELLWSLLLLDID